MNRKRAAKLRTSRRFRAMRMAWLTDHPWCAECERQGRLNLADELDHVVPVSKRPDWFWRRSNWQSLCRRCHERKTASENKKKEMTPIEKKWSKLYELARHRRTGGG